MYIIYVYLREIRSGTIPITSHEYPVLYCAWSSLDWKILILGLSSTETPGKRSFRSTPKDYPSQKNIERSTRELKVHWSRDRCEA